MTSQVASTAAAPPSGARNTSMRTAAREKNDEFYTQLQDIEDELKHYWPHLVGKTVFCNCDDPEKSNFWLYFTRNFEHLKLAKVVATHYTSVAPSYMLEYFGKDRPVVKSPLVGNGDFRSPECVALLREADLVVTNPPFSLFREYLAQLGEHKKKFLVIGSSSTVICKATFKLVKEGALWLGITAPKKFKQPDGTLKQFGNISWFTNLTHKKRNEAIVLFKRYAGNESEYPRFDNYDAINIAKVAHIPMDYTGFMGVPITFLEKFNPNQFEILGLTNTGEENPGIRLPGTEHGRALVDGREIFTRILIRHVGHHTDHQPSTS